ncbi:hypothetical protein [Nonomuraea sp. NPDC050783]|uniref:hypothetical protein n=1 Tax=Nonomuraea sp. NPDC050783 TaxID=3154634 RepID=UPI00346548F0
MSNIQLLRYNIEPGRMDDFIGWWRGLVPIREQYGYRLLFALADRENHQFVWAVEHDLPMEEAEAVYRRAPERDEHWLTNPDVVVSSVVNVVDPIMTAWPGSAG